MNDNASTSPISVTKVVRISVIAQVTEPGPVLAPPEYSSKVETKYAFVGRNAKVHLPDIIATGSVDETIDLGEAKAFATYDAETRQIYIKGKDLNVVG